MSKLYFLLNIRTRDGEHNDHYLFKDLEYAKEFAKEAMEQDFKNARIVQMSPTEWIIFEGAWEGYSNERLQNVATYDWEVTIKEIQLED